MSFALLLHLLGVIVWVGGMAFANFALRPAVGILPPPQRLTLLAAVFGRFLPWVAVSVVLILGSGAVMIGLSGGMKAVGANVLAMTGLGVLMALIFFYIFVAPFRALRAAVAAGDWERAGRGMARIRVLVATNLMLGILALPFAVSGR
jgi:uncharacterized membrane protein